MQTTRISFAALILAPLLLALSTFLWNRGEYGVAGGTLLGLSTVFWIGCFAVLFGLLRRKFPIYSSLGFIIAVYGCLGGANFGIAGVFSETFGISHREFLQGAAGHPMGFNLLLFWPGPLFPLSLLVLGIQLARKRVIPGWVAAMVCLGALAFPVSRIPRIEWIAHTADVLLAIPLFYLGCRGMFSNDFNRNLPV
jgi:hypothetical protein